MKNTIIISHPRSGSSWLQASLPLHNMFELFNTRNIEKIQFIDGVCVDSRFTLIERTLDQRIAECEHRAMLYDRIRQNKSVKFHVHQLDDWALKWIERHLPTSTLMFIERRDKVKAFKSLLISNALGKFRGVHTQQTVEIDPDTIDSCYAAIWGRNEYLEKLLRAPQRTHVFYEDLINKTTFIPGQRPAAMAIQDTSAKVQISNWDEITDILSKGQYDLSDRRIY